MPRQSSGENAQDGDLLNRVSCQTPSNAFDISRDIFTVSLDDRTPELGNGSTSDQFSGRVGSRIGEHECTDSSPSKRKYVQFYYFHYVGYQRNRAIVFVKSFSSFCIFGCYGVCKGRNWHSTKTKSCY